MTLPSYPITIRQTHIALIMFGIFIGFSFNVLFGNTYWMPVIKRKSDINYKSLDLVDNNSVANQLYKDVKILCWIMTCPRAHRRKAVHIMRTWGKRCNKLIFMSTAKDDKIGAIELPVKEGRDYLWAKTKEAFKYIYQHHLNEYDWFLKADDDTYVVVENLRFMLHSYDKDFPFYFGCKFKPHVKQGYMGGGPGYALSREAVRRFVEIALPNEGLCRPENYGLEDIEVGKCMENVNATAGDSRDSDNRGRFFPFPPRLHLHPKLIGNDSWYWNYLYYKDPGGLNCCSNHAISFHYIVPADLYVLDYLIYQLQPYGINRVYDP